jgi:Ca2+-binding RTX toxin-like protein
MSEVNQFEQFLNRLSFRELTAGSPGSESEIEVEDKINASKDKISDLRNSKMQEINDSYTEYMGISLFDNESYNPPPDLTTFAMGEEDDSLPPPDLTTLAMGEEDDSLPPPDLTTLAMGEEDDSIINFGENKSIIGTDEADIIDNYGNKSSVSAGKGNDDIYNVSNESSIRSGRGDDFINNYGTNNKINSGSGNDYIHSQGKNNDIKAGMGDDRIYLGNDSAGSKINAGRGDDIIELEKQETGSISVKGGTGNDTLLIYGSENDYNKGVNANTGEITYTHKTLGSSIKVDKDVENIKFQTNN